MASECLGECSESTGCSDMAFGWLGLMKRTISEN
jgi:hypothetical protein